jgi:hypothetical protein
LDEEVDLWASERIKWLKDESQAWWPIIKERVPEARFVEHGVSSEALDAVFAIEKPPSRSPKSPGSPRSPKSRKSLNEAWSESVSVSAGPDSPRRSKAGTQDWSGGSPASRSTRCTRSGRNGASRNVPDDADSIISSMSAQHILTGEAPPLAGSWSEVASSVANLDHYREAFFAGLEGKSWLPWDRTDMNDATTPLTQEQSLKSLVAEEHTTSIRTTVQEHTNSMTEERTPGAKSIRTETTDGDSGLNGVLENLKICYPEESDERLRNALLKSRGDHCAAWRLIATSNQDDMFVDYISGNRNLHCFKRPNRAGNERVFLRNSNDTCKVVYLPVSEGTSIPCVVPLHAMESSLTEAMGKLWSSKGGREEAAEVLLRGKCF